jgi:hypothetical protein
MDALDAMLSAVAGEVSGPGARRFVEAVHQSDRLSTHAAFQRTSRYLADQMRRLGLVDVRLIEYPTDGRTRIGDWLPSPAWDAEAAELEVLDPAALAGVLQRYPDTNTCVAILSEPTPAGGLTAELVDVDAPSAPRRLGGRIALIHGRPAGVRPGLIRRGAAAIVSDTLYDPARRIAEPEAVAWENVWHEPWDRPRCPVMMINGFQGQALRRALARGTRVVVRMKVKARNYRGHLLTATGVLPGRDRGEEIVGIAHASEVGANDNASGCGGLLEAARALIALQKRKKIPRLRRSIRLLFPFECYGTIAWLTRARRRAEILAGINPDMIGEDFTKCGSTLDVHLAFDSAPGPGNALVLDVLRRVTQADPTYRWIARPPAIDDNAFLCDPNVGGPTPMLVMQPDPAYHSNLDTMDRVSPAVMASSTTAVATYLGLLASAGSPEAGRLADETFFHFRRRLDDFLRSLTDEPQDTDPHPAVQIRTLAAVGAEHIAACGRYAAGAGRAAAARRVRRLIEDWRADCQSALARRGWADVQDAPAPAAARAVPVRKEPYLPAGDRLSKAEKKQFVRMAGTSFPWSAGLAECLFLSNGRRTIFETHRRVSLRSAFTLRKTIGIFRALEKFGYVKLSK